MLKTTVAMGAVRLAALPGMIMRIPDVGSRYLMGFLNSNNEPFDGAKAYRVTLLKNIPARAFWSLTLYDNQTRSMLQTP